MTLLHARVRLDDPRARSPKRRLGRARLALTLARANTKV